MKKVPGYVMYIGDVTLKNYNKDYQYDLPFRKGQSFNVYQGYNGNFSHQNENSIDFSMPEGTEIAAAREGVVVDFVSHNNKGCPTRNCIDQANYITILHPDGTFAQYYHLKQNGIKVNKGDQVKKGDVIGLSGNTGWSKGPHLHFVCYLPRVEENKYRETVKTLFRTGNGTKTEFLVEKKRIQKDIKNAALRKTVNSDFIHYIFRFLLQSFRNTFVNHGNNSRDIFHFIFFFRICY